MTITLYRAANDSDVSGGTSGACTSFAADIDVARLYLANPGFGGHTLYRLTVEIDESRVLDIYDSRDPVGDLMDRAGIARHPGAIGADEWVSYVAGELCAAGVDWVRVRESYPEDAETWIYVGADQWLGDGMVAL